jgi:hypothetical protein
MVLQRLYCLVGPHLFYDLEQLSEHVANLSEQFRLFVIRGCHFGLSFGFVGEQCKGHHKANYQDCQSEPGTAKELVLIEGTFGRRRDKIVS